MGDFLPRDMYDNYIAYNQFSAHCIFYYIAVYKYNQVLKLKDI